MNRTDSIINFVVNVVSKFHFQTQLGYIFSQSVEMLCFIRSAIYYFSTLDCVLIFCLNRVRTKLQFASTVRNYLTSSDSKKPEAFIGSS